MHTKLTLSLRDAALVPADAPPTPPACARAILAVLDPARQQGPASGWHSDFAWAGLVQFHTFVERGPGFVVVTVMMTAPTLVVGRLTVLGFETWPVIADMDW